ncbi:putative chaperonin containing T-complex 1 zeta subunit, tcpz protein [Gregarina niphandrodes]|uniref:Chaperonin containing T-complex 1 zeta subunit, tcpz protein n=1 Tax=Gregarina niphandrodes TaxID=110365 RepID=A0A023BAN2_GRENI|nr:putative chaperonin containing T-complex 1 zeta subunit, tcpz protein [Gregarina niphandrodes]EZG78414.1 putative chaperonin containing T-complex 1 zeta subunit, tcpz protein [Gregarina niphandrodes]|eukprot:XP_011129313.1 putative chaperonin containing T-complex 1 zeta subunit, tcpz protein [Gregarina niphandrodes]
MSSLHTLNPRADLLRREQAFEASLVAARGLQDIMASNLGPRGTQKMLVGGAGQIKITKDGNVLLKEMHIQHPTAAIIARAATAQDVVVGDGCTSDIVLVGEMMKLADRVLSEGVHPRRLAEGLDLARAEALRFLSEFKRTRTAVWDDRELLLSVARTSLTTKLEPEMAERLADILVSAMLCILGPHPEQMAQEALEGRIPLDLFMVEVLHIKGGVKNETRFVKGMVMDHGCRHQDMPSSLRDCFVLTCNVSLEYERTEVNSAFFYSSAEQRSKLADAERRYTDNKVKKIIELKRELCHGPDGAPNGKSFVVFNQKGIDPPALEMLAREGIMALRRVKRRNMERLTLCCGGQAVNSVEGLRAEDLGHADQVWEIAMGDEKYTFVEGVKDPRSCCILVKAPTDHAIEQIKDAIRDGLRALKNTVDDLALVPGAGAFELACAEHLHRYAEAHVCGKPQLGVKLLADALLAIPKTLAKNAGFDPQDVLLALQQQYRQLTANQPEGAPLPDVGVDLVTGEPCGPAALGIWDNVAVKRQSIVLTTTITAQLLLVDEVIKAGKQMGNKQ